MLDEPTRRKLAYIQQLLQTGRIQAAHQLIDTLPEPLANEWRHQLAQPPQTRKKPIVWLVVGLLAFLGGMILLGVVLSADNQPSSVVQIRQTPTLTATFIPSLTASPSATLAPTLVAQLASTPSPQTPLIQIQSELTTDVRNQAGWEADIIGKVKQGDVFSVLETLTHEGETWYQIQFGDGQTGWVSDLIAVQLDATLSQPTTVAELVPPTAVIFPTATPSADIFLRRTPVLSHIDEAVARIFATGQQLGRNPRMVTIVGDSNSTAETFLRPFDNGRYDLGNYAHLQPTVDFFQGSFGRGSLAVEIGFNSATIQDALMANPAQCEGGESPLVCEYRVSQASFAVIMFGANDLIHISPENYERYLTRLVETSLELGVIPILTTFPRRPDYAEQEALALNAAMVRVADHYQVPLINLWLAAQTLPDYGITADNVHLNQGGESIIFAGDEQQWGQTLRNLLTLQMLDALRQTLGLGG